MFLSSLVTITCVLSQLSAPSLPGHFPHPLYPVMEENYSADAWILESFSISLAEYFQSPLLEDDSLLHTQQVPVTGDSFTLSPRSASGPVLSGSKVHREDESLPGLQGNSLREAVQALGIHCTGLPAGEPRKRWLCCFPRKAESRHGW